MSDTAQALQLSDTQEMEATSHLVSGEGHNPTQHCLAIMLPLCESIESGGKATCHDIAQGMCRPDTAFIKCLLGPQASEGCGTAGFPAGCLCAPQTLVVTDQAPDKLLAPGKQHNN
jgi:hypothetical protein